MAILIDPPRWPSRGRRWSHLASDTSVRELHAFAARLGMSEHGFEGDHYDLPEERYAQAVRAGAIPVSTRELLRRLRISGLRRVKRRGERVVASHGDKATGHRVDALLSAKPPLGPVVRVHAVLVHDGHVLVVDEGEGYLLPSAEVCGDVPPAWVIGRELVAGLVGAARAGGAVRQVGYLRRVREGRAAPVDVELVLRWPDAATPDGDLRALAAVAPDGDPRALVALPPVPQPTRVEGSAGPGATDTCVLQWVPVRRAVVLLPVHLAPVALSEHRRAWAPELEDPGPFNPEAR